MQKSREHPIEINKEEFRKIGYTLIDRIADFNATLHQRPVTTGESPKQVQELLGNADLPDEGTPLSELISETTKLLFDHSLFNGHPRFMGYITSSSAPAGALADLLAATVNPNVGAYILSPVATEIEKQTIRWLAQFIGVSPEYGGILVSGGNMANITGFLAARNAKASPDLKEEGMGGANSRLRVYCPGTTHTWIEKAAILSGMGTNAIRWVPTDSSNKMDNDALEKILLEDLKNGFKPFMVVGTAGDVSTGAVDDLSAVAVICRTYDLWFHIDGAYGIPAAGIPELKELFMGLEAADSIALDPHKWLYTPLEAGCTLVKNPRHLTDAFSSHPAYYNFDKYDDVPAMNFYESGLQNSRGFRALKVWLTLRQVGKIGYLKLISDDIELARLMYRLADEHPELEAVTQSLSITTLRYVPNKDPLPKEQRAYLNSLNEALLDELQKGGEVFLSNAIVNGRYCLRGCIVNFRTSAKDIEMIIETIVRTGRKIVPRLSGKYASPEMNESSDSPA